MEELNENSLKLLYDEELFIVKEKTTTSPPKINVASEPEPAPYKGFAKKDIVVLFEDSSQDKPSVSNESLLVNILKAIGLTIEDVAIINQSVAKTDWKEHASASRVLAFGVSPEVYGVSSELYAITNSQNIQWLFADSLDALAANKVLKGKLWSNLQVLFPG